MATTMNYTSNASRKVKPTIIKTIITICENDVNSKKAVNKCADIAKKITTIITKLTSYIEDSCMQSNFRLNKIYKTEEITKNNTKTINKVFDKYNTTLQISAEFKNSDKVIEELSSLLDMLNKNNCNFVYNCDITEDERNFLNNSLYNEAINKGIENIKEIIIGTSLHSSTRATTNPIINVLQIRDSSLKNNNYSLYESEFRCRTSDTYNNDELISDMLNMLFNNDIIVTQSIDLTVEIQS